MKHTPGPWRFTQNEIRSHNGRRQLLVNGVALPSGNHPQDQEATANARLIAAAPELLDALKAILEKAWLARRDELDHTVNVNVLREEAQAAIAKAEGK